MKSHFLNEKTYNHVAFKVFSFEQSIERTEKPFNLFPTKILFLYHLFNFL